MIEYRFCWSAGSNISFKGETDWVSAEDPDATAEEVERYFTSGRMDCEGLDIVLSESGFEWGIETRQSTEGSEGA